MSHLRANILERIHLRKFPKVGSFYPYSDGAVLAQNIIGSLEVMFNGGL